MSHIRALPINKVLHFYRQFSTLYPRVRHLFHRRVPVLKSIATGLCYKLIRKADERFCNGNKILFLKVESIKLIE